MKKQEHVLIRPVIPYHVLGLALSWCRISPKIIPVLKPQTCFFRKTSRLSLRLIGKWFVCPQILQHSSLAACVSRRGLSELLWQLLGALKDTALLALPDVAQLHRTINILFVRYFEAVRPNESLG